MIRMFLILLIALCFGGKVWCAQTLRIGIQETILQGQEKELIYETISSLKLKLRRTYRGRFKITKSIFSFPRPPSL